MLKDARASFERGLAISKAAYGPDHRKVTKTLIDLGIVRRGKIAKYVISISLVVITGSSREQGGVPKMRHEQAAARRH